MTNDYISRTDLAALLNVPHNTTLRDKIKEAGVTVEVIDRRACLRTCDLPAIFKIYGKNMPARACEQPLPHSAQAAEPTDLRILEPSIPNRAGDAHTLRHSAPINFSVAANIISTNTPTPDNSLAHIKTQLEILERDTVNIREIDALRDAIQALKQKVDALDRAVPLLHQTITAIKPTPPDEEIYRRLCALEAAETEDEELPPYTQVQVKINILHICGKLFDLLETVTRVACIALLWIIFCRRWADALAALWIPPGHSSHTWGNHSNVIKASKLQPTGKLTRKAICK